MRRGPFAACTLASAAANPGIIRTKAKMTTAASTPAREGAEDQNPITIGILALQGDYEAHARAFANAGARTLLVRKPEELQGLDGLVLPGGESTTMLKFLEGHGFFDTLGEFVSNTPTFATCAGCILVAREVLHPKQRSLGVLDATVERNAYGRQIDSAILTLPTELPGGPLEMVFIRAPRIARVGPGVKVIAQRDGFPTLVRQGHLLVATFHPEMSTDTRVQQLFLEMVRRHRKASRQHYGTSEGL
jgi:pyridoxal 5'-phosphate synthase pdxT subunit